MASDDKNLKGRLDLPPGDDVVPVPPPVDEIPKANRFCDLVLTGGVASGVVYPWAIVELARHYRFRNIGGTSVGAMAAALAAAAEYGRRTGHQAPFETLRRLPAALGERMDDGRTRMVSLFQTNDRGKRLIDLWARLFSGESNEGGVSILGSPAATTAQKDNEDDAIEPVPSFRFRRVLTTTLQVYRQPAGWSLVVGILVAALACWPFEVSLAWGVRLVLGLLFVVAALTTGVLLAIWSDVRHGLIDNELGLCSGATMPGSTTGQSGLTEWLHQGIQRSAGLKTTDPPLTFRDLWTAPAHPGAPRDRVDEKSPTSDRSINLQMVTTSVTHGRPYRLPLDDTSPLYFRFEEMRAYFPPVVCAALEAASRPYVARPGSDKEPLLESAAMRELPGADLPIVVAARLSLSFPLLFSAVRLWAIDYEAPRGKRRFRPCHFTDGGAASNFPIHLFDATLPRWPTFGMWLDRRKPYAYTKEDGSDVDVWLPRFNGQGRGDGWIRFHPEARPGRKKAQDTCRAQAGLLFGFALAIATSAVDWRDRAALRLPHVRNRVARLFLRPGEGGLNIGMSREQILRMAHRYGTETGKLFVERFKNVDGRPSQAWREQRWVRMELFLEGLHERMAGFAVGADWNTDTPPIDEAVEDAVVDGPVDDRRDDGRISHEQAKALSRLIKELRRLESEFREVELEPSKRKPLPELRLRAPL